MDIQSPATTLSLLVVWLAIAAFALVTFAYYIISRRARHQVAGSLRERQQDRDDESPDPRKLAVVALEVAGAVLLIAILGVLTYSIVNLHFNVVDRTDEAAKISRRYIDEEYHERRVTPLLLFSAFNDSTVAGESSEIGVPQRIRLKLIDARMGKHQCDRNFLIAVARQATVRLNTLDLDISKAPSIDDGNDCYVTWDWIGVPRSGGTSLAIAELGVRTPTGLVHVSKLIPIVTSKERGEVLTSSVSAIVVAFLSLCGVLTTAALNRKPPAAQESDGTA